MTFKRRLLLAVMGILVILLCANILVSVYKSRLYVSDQMAVLSQDAATSLGFAISTASRDDKNVQASSMVDVVFDSGYYLSVSYFDVDGNMVVSRARNIEIENVPAWFVNVMHVPIQVGKAEVMSGWFRLGEVHVLAHPGYAYRELWRLALEQSFLFLFTLVFAYGVIALLLTSITKPLYRLETHVKAIGNREFIEESVIPQSGEFRRVVLAVNAMARKLRESFQSQLALIGSLREEAHMDALTSLPNRGEFDARLAAWLASDEGNGPALMVLVSVVDLLALNNSEGRDAGDRLLLSVSKVLGGIAHDQEHALMGRRSGTDFVLFIPGVFPAEADKTLGLIHETFIGQMDADSLTIGGAVTSRLADTSTLLQAADESLRYFHSDQVSPKAVNVDDENIIHRSASDWLPVLESAIDSQRLVLFFQPVFSGVDTKPHHFEVLCRIRDGEQYCDAGIFWPLVERFDLSERIDKEVIRRALSLLASYPDVRLHVNVATASLRKARFITWLDAHMAGVPRAVCSRLNIEVPERVFLQVEELVKPVLAVINRYSVGLVIDRFGILATSMAFACELGIQHVKLDRRFVSGIATSPENRFYIHTLVDICRTHDIVFACEGVENEADLLALKKLGVQAYQGYLLGRPSSELTMDASG